MEPRAQAGFSLFGSPPNLDDLDLATSASHLLDLLVEPETSPSPWPDQGQRSERQQRDSAEEPPGGGDEMDQRRMSVANLVYGDPSSPRQTQTMDGGPWLHGTANGNGNGNGASGSSHRERELDSRDDDDDRDDRPVKRKRHRTKASCVPCQRRKTRCDPADDGGSRCAGCVKRQDTCAWDLPASTAPSTGNVGQDELEAIKRRLQRLEHQMSGKVDKAPTFPSSSSYSPSEPTSSSLPHSLAHSLVRAPHHPPFPGSLASSGSGPLPALHPPLPPLNSKSETEDAAQVLEDLALGGRRPYKSLGINSEVPVRAPAGPTIVQPGAFTSIFAPYNSVTVDTASLMRALPEQPVAEALVTLYFAEISWVYHVLHRPTFLTEQNQLWNTIRAGAQDPLDPAWLSTYYIVLAWAASSLQNGSKVPGPLRHFSHPELAALPRVWADAAEQCLNASSWASKPQLRAVQAILLKISYNRPSAQGQSPGLDGSSFFVWLAAAARICQLLGFHKLGKDAANLMPDDDPGLPARSCTLKRELAKRVWYWIVVHDWMFCTSDSTASYSMNQVPFNSFDTDPPADVNEDDLGLGTALPARPASYMTDYSYTKALFVVAQYQMVASELSKKGPPRYATTILQLSAGLHDEIERVDAMTDCSNPHLMPYHKPLILAILHNRVLRLHRSFFMRGINPSSPEDKEYEASVEASLKSAEAVCIALRDLGENGHQSHLWFIPGYGLGAAITVFLGLLKKTEQGLSTTHERQLVLFVREFYASSTGEISRQACLIIDQLLAAPPSSAHNPAAHLFRQVAERVTLPSSRVTSAPNTRASSPGRGFFSSFQASMGFEPMMEAEPESFDSTASRHALATLAALEFPQSLSGPTTTTDWSELLKSMADYD